MAKIKLQIINTLVEFSKKIEFSIIAVLYMECSGKYAMYRQTLWTAIMCAMTATVATTTFANFSDDSQVQLKFKNFYLDRQYNSAPAKNWGSWS